MYSALMFRNRRVRETVALVCTASVINLSLVSGCGQQHQQHDQPKKRRPWLTYTSPHSRDDSDARFMAMLRHMSDDERIPLAAALQLLPDIETEDFGSYGLKPYRHYADSPETATANKPLRPKTFNEVPPEVVKQALAAGRLDREKYVSPEAIKNGILWVSSHTFTYPFRDTINYHEIVQWVAREMGVPDATVKAQPTFELERKILEKFFEDLWDRLTPAQREEALRRLEKELGKPIPNKKAIAALGGAAALTALGAAVSLSGFAFYTTMSVVIYTMGSLLGITFPFAVYTGASSLVALLTGPIGMVLVGVLVGSAAVLLGKASVERTAAFIIALHLLKAKAFDEAGILR